MINTSLGSTKKKKKLEVMGRMFDQLQKKAIAQVSDSGKKNDLGELHNSELLNVEKSPSTRGHSRCGNKNKYAPKYRTALTNA